MAIIDCRFGPRFQNIATRIKVIIPDGSHPETTDGDGKYPVVWMLHGGGGNSTDLLCRMPLVELAQQFGVAFVVPEAQNSCYRNMVYGPQWREFITQKLPAYVARNYPLSALRQKNLMTGFSMGGYGSLQYALLAPERYAFAAPMSQGNEAVRKYADGVLEPRFDAQLEAVFGDDRAALANTDANCYTLLRQAPMQAKQVRFLLAAGKADFTYEDTVKMRDEMRAQGYSVAWRENEGAHDFASWNAFLPEILAWFCDARHAADSARK